MSVHKFFKSFNLNNYLAIADKIRPEELLQEISLVLKF